MPAFVCQHWAVAPFQLGGRPLLAEYFPNPEGPLPVGALVRYGLVAVAVVVVLVVLRRLVRLRRGADRIAQPELAIDVARMPTGGPRGNVRLEFLHTPVRLAAVVLAPVGRTGRLPSDAVLPAVIDQLVPGLMEVLEVDRPKFHRWPAQVSSQGFVMTFFREASLPGAQGKGSPWCSIAGRFEANGQPYLIGLVCCAAKKNNLSQLGVSQSGGWLDALRVRRAGG